MQGVLFKTDGGGRRGDSPVLVIGFEREVKDSPCPEEQEE